MALANVFTSLNGIRPFKTTSRIQVKIVHSWTQYTSYTGETIEMILADLEEKKFQQRRRSFQNGRTRYLSHSMDANADLKLLFRFIRGPKSDEDLRTFNGVVYPTYKEVCEARGLLE
ncbi:hypothetical protein ISN44_As08g030800 [Arabidopsis suecica]|uniref:Replication protein A 70 kDa DNA-binding subunit B/D first OB fold domain-containing protein n=1 Tax=Arabidopsis suecica TaxID=45249 RepID=A0A8T2BBX9_ARASU|nr:hypothetical protein ISN44_As08g030800 [Arabidopsis suecica]